MPVLSSCYFHSEALSGHHLSLSHFLKVQYHMRSLPCLFHNWKQLCKIGHFFSNITQLGWTWPLPHAILKLMFLFLEECVWAAEWGRIGKTDSFFPSSLREEPITSMIFFQFHRSVEFSSDSGHRNLRPVFKEAKSCTKRNVCISIYVIPIYVYIYLYILLFGKFS